MIYACTSSVVSHVAWPKLVSLLYAVTLNERCIFCRLSMETAILEPVHGPFPDFLHVIIAKFLYTNSEIFYYSSA